MVSTRTGALKKAKAHHLFRTLPGWNTVLSIMTVHDNGSPTMVSTDGPMAVSTAVPVLVEVTTDVDPISMEDIDDGGSNVVFYSGYASGKSGGEEKYKPSENN